MACDIHIIVPYERHGHAAVVIDHIVRRIELSKLSRGWRVWTKHALSRAHKVFWKTRMASTERSFASLTADWREHELAQSQDAVRAL